MAFFSAVSLASIIDVQSKLEPDPSGMTAVHTQILIHVTDGSLLHNAHQNIIAWILGVTAYSFTLACDFSYNFPYQTPLPP